MSASQLQSYRRTLGFVFQDFRLISRMTVFQNVAFVMRVLGVTDIVQQRKTFQVLKWVGLQHRMNALPEELSGGEQQRVAIARALANRPRVLLADEPTGNLDPRTSEGVFEMLIALVRSEGLSALIATHNYELSKKMDRVLVLDKGLLVERVEV